MLNDPAIRGLLQWLSLVIARVTPVVVFTPLLGGQGVPRRLRTGVAVAFSIVLVLILAPSQTPPIEPFVFVSLLVKEAVLGVMLALIVRIAFGLFTMCGAIIDGVKLGHHPIGMDPIGDAQVSAIARFLPLLVWTAFLSMGGAGLLVQGLVQTFLSVPPDTMTPGELLAPQRTLSLIPLTQAMIHFAAMFAAPIVAVTFLLDITLGAINRVSPQIQSFFLSMGVKPSVALGVLMLSLPAIVAVAPDWAESVGEALIYTLKADVADLAADAPGRGDDVGQ